MKTMSRLASQERLAALERSGLLHKTPNERVRHLVYTAYTLLRADAAQLNILTDTHQHTVVEWPRASPHAVSSMPVGDSGCYRVMLAEETMAIEDTLEHPQMCVLPWTAIFRGYLGTVICYDNQPIGSLCALTVEPRKWTALDIVTLESLAKLVAISVDA